MNLIRQIYIVLCFVPISLIVYAGITSHPISDPKIPYSGLEFIVAAIYLGLTLLALGCILAVVLKINRQPIRETILAAFLAGLPACILLLCC